jgi:hypothetical protein
MSPTRNDKMPKILDALEIDGRFPAFASREARAIGWNSSSMELHQLLEPAQRDVSLRFSSNDRQ